jgi:hypothetical protein
MGRDPRHDVLAKADFLLAIGRGVGEAARVGELG